MSNVYVKTRIYSGDKSIKYLEEIKNQVILIVCDKFLVESKAVSYLTDIIISIYMTV